MCFFERFCGLELPPIWMPTFSSPEPAEPERQPIGSPAAASEKHPIASLEAPAELPEYSLTLVPTIEPNGWRNSDYHREFWYNSHVGRRTQNGSQMITKSKVLVFFFPLTSEHCRCNDGT